MSASRPDLDRLTQRESAASPGPWWSFYGGEPNRIGDASREVALALTDCSDGVNQDARFIAMARTMMPDLLAYIRYLKAESATLKDIKQSRQAKKIENANATRTINAAEERRLKLAKERQAKRRRA